MKQQRLTFRQKLPAYAFSLFLLGLWSLVAYVIDASYILPSPLQVLRRFWDLRQSLLLVHLPYTLGIATLGLLLSFLIGTGIALLMSRSNLAKEALYPGLVISQTVPILAIAPLFILWFGYGIWAKVVVTILLSFFPFAMTIYDALSSCPQELEELLLTYGASPSDRLWKLRVPYALPSLFSALRLAIPAALVGATIGEWLGSQTGLGYFSKRMMTQLDGGAVFAPVLLSALIAILLVSLVNWLEKRLVPWKGER